MRYLFVIALVAAACGGDDRPEGDCVPGSNNRYLPFEVGNSWSYETYDAAAPAEVFPKSQSVMEERNHPDDGMPMLVQQTIKAKGSTVNWLRLDGDRLVRLQQIDYDLDDIEERTTIYEPPRLRLDESDARVTAGATWQESYMEIATDAMTMQEVRRSITENWEVIDVDVACPGEFSDFDCLYVQRAQAGVPPKGFWFARGMGKVQEQGGQVETLLACSVN